MNIDNLTINKSTAPIGSSTNYTIDFSITTTGLQIENGTLQVPQSILDDLTGTQQKEYVFKVIKNKFIGDDN